jgi:hypothetical protein
MKIFGGDIFVQKGIHQDELEQFLRTIGKLDQVKNDEVRCDACEEVLSKSSIGKISKTKGDIKFFCDNYVCYVENNAHVSKSSLNQEYLALAKLSDEIEQIESVDPSAGQNEDQLEISSD